MWWFVSAMAWAAEPAGYWWPDDLAAISKLYGTSSEQLQGPFAEREQELGRTAAAIREYRVALELLGDRAPAAERERLEALEALHAHNHAALSAFADQLVSDYDAAFTAAVERAAASRGAVVQCQGQIPAPSSGPRIPGAPRKTFANPDCAGADLNAALAAAVDGDAAAVAAIGAILARSWPTPEPLPVAAQPAVGGGERWVRVVDLMRAGARGALARIDHADDEARDAIEAAMETATTEAELQALVPKVQAIEAQTASARAGLAAPVLAVAAARMAKWKGEALPGWCANPAALGGCTGADASNDLVARLLADKKVAAAFPEE
jgi:hypothetical protein